MPTATLALFSFQTDAYPPILLEDRRPFALRSGACDPLFTIQVARYLHVQSPRSGHTTGRDFFVPTAHPRPETSCRREVDGASATA
jgi:hypothetical protein